jgi:hypothetical protein
MNFLGFESREGQKVFPFLVSKSPRPAMGTTQHYVYSVLDFFFGIKQPGLDVNHSPASAKVKNEWRYNFAFPIRLRDLDRGTFATTSRTVLSN